MTAGRGGAILTHDATVLQRVKIYAERGNLAFPLSELQAAVLIPQLAKLRTRNRTRQQNVALLRQIFRDTRALRPVEAPADDGLPSFYKVAFRLVDHGAGARRDQFIAAAQAEGIAVGPGFRSFVRRGTKRCRCSTPLPASAQAAAQTVLLHHPALLQSREYVSQLSSNACQGGYDARSEPSITYAMQDFATREIKCGYRDNRRSRLGRVLLRLAGSLG